MPEVYKFLLRLGLIWLLILPVWLWAITPYYGHALTATANVLFRANFLSGDDLRYEYVHPCVKGSIEFAVQDRIEARTGRGSLRFTMDGERFQFSFTVWAALLLATPFAGKWKKKLSFFLIGLAVVFLIQELDLLLQTAEEKLTYMDSDEFRRRFLPPGMYDQFLGFCGRYFLLIGYIAAPIAIWITFGPRRLSAAVGRAAVNRESQIGQDTARKKSLAQ